MSLSIPDFWKLVLESKLLTREQCQHLATSYGSSQGATADVNALAKWLVGQNVLSRYQASILLAGRAGPFAYGDYKIYDRVESGRLAGWFRAVHAGTNHPVMLKFLAGDAAQSAQRERGGRAPPGATSAAGSFGACLAWRAMAGSKTSGPMCGPGRLRRAGPHRADAVRRVQPAPRSVTVPATPTHGPPAAPMIGRNPERSPLAEARRAFKPVPGGRGRGGTRFPKGGRLSGGPKPTMCALCHRRAQSAPHPVLRFRVRRARPARPNKRRYRPSATACCARQSRHRCRPCSPRPACSRPGSPGQPPRRGR